MANANSNVISLFHPMPLRDYFAGIALNHFLGTYLFRQDFFEQFEETLRISTRNAYVVADMMLEERKD